MSTHVPKVLLVSALFVLVATSPALAQNPSGEQNVSEAAEPPKEPEVGR